MFHDHDDSLKKMVCRNLLYTSMLKFEAVDRVDRCSCFLSVVLKGHLRDISRDVFSSMPLLGGGMPLPPKQEQAILLLDENHDIIVSDLMETGYKYLMTPMIMGLFHSTVRDGPTWGNPFL